MFGHVYYWGFSLTDNSAEFLRDTKKFWFQIVADGIFSVDSFFFLSGFLVTSGIFKVVSKGGRFPWAKYYIHRYLRLTPVYGFVFLIYSELAGYMESGPTWEPTTVSPACDTWSTIAPLDFALLALKLVRSGSGGPISSTFRIWCRATRQCA
eukprot:m.377208 g.377208  ORF g.377208 m.377208 type:complete len:152 (-) comp56191_c0_seq42:1157-1612(-)